ncbi:MAG: peptide chain release factor 1 [Clostridia bacterium]|nr:peptide chain release factor 1 [Clostridia bacterium]
MLDKLRDTEQKYIGIEDSLADPEIMSRTGEYAVLMKEYKALTPVVEKYRQYRATKNNIEGINQMLEGELDREMRELASEELKTAKEELTALEEELKVLLLPRDENDDKNVIVEIRAGAGGEEAALFAGVLYRMYGMFSDKEGFRISVMNSNPTELGGFRQIAFNVEGDGAYSRFKFESGVHRVQRVPETETQGRIHTSTVTVAVLPEAEEVEIEINPADLKFETCKSSGAGGQHINKTESAVRILHIPTGTVVECQEERSQFKNRDKAMKMLRAILYDRKQREQSDKIAKDRRDQVGTGDRSEKIRTYNYPQSRVTDHRIKMTIHSLDDFLNGNIGEMIDALATAEAAEKLKGEQA